MNRIQKTRKIKIKLKADICLQARQHTYILCKTGTGNTCGPKRQDVPIPLIAYTIVVNKQSGNMQYSKKARYGNRGNAQKYTTIYNLQGGGHMALNTVFHLHNTVFTTHDNQHPSTISW